MVAKRSSGVERKPPFQIRAQALREPPAAANAGTVASFALPDDLAPTPPDPASGEQWRTADLKRALSAARDADLKNYRVEIAPDGTISLVVSSSPAG